MKISQTIQILNGYANNRKRDAWVAQGSQLATLATTSYFAGTLYVVDEETSDLNGALLLCSDPVYSAIDWAQYQYVNNNIQRVDTLHIPSEFILILTADEILEITEPVDNAFVPFQETVVESAPSVVIPEFELRRILVDVGVPFVTWEEIEYTVDEIKELIVRPSLETYYKYFPIIREQHVAVGANGRFEASIPSDPNFIVIVGCFGSNSDAGDLSTVGVGTAFQYYRDTILGGLFMGGNSMGAATAHGRRRAGNMIKFNHNDVVTNQLNMATYKSMLNSYARVKYTRRADKVEGYHSGARFVTIEWGYLDSNWDIIPFERKEEIRKLAGGRALKILGKLRNQSSPGPNKIDYTKWIEDGEKMETEVITHWNEFTKAVVVRSR